MEQMLLPLALCGHLAPMAYVRPMLASCRARLRYHSRLSAVRRLGSSAATGAETPNSPLSLLIFHRHGDRSPLRGHTPDEELAAQPGKAADDGEGGVPPAAKTAEDYWRRQLVSPEEVRRLDKLYPVKRSPGEAVPPDEESAPFGCLTSLGLQQLRERGRVFRQGYSVDGIDAARVEVFSTNYRRTQLSAQGFLDGFLGDAEGGRRGGMVPVVVRPKADDFLNQWESRGHVMYERMMMVESGDAFQETEESVGGPLKRKLHHLDPALFPLPQGGRFRWMMAADYFMSARARGLRVAPELDALGTATIRHLIWRFSRFYGDKEMMKTMAGPLLAHILDCAKTGSIPAGTRNRDSRTVSGTVPETEGVGGSSSTLSRVVSSSCHDVTVLALLYALEAHLIEDQDYWPPYACTIAFVVSGSQREGRSGPREPRGGREEDEGEGGVLLNISVDGEPLRSRLFPGQGDGGAIPLSVFRAAVEHLLPPLSPPPS